MPERHAKPRSPRYSLIQARERKGLTQAELARRLGLGRIAVTRVERGMRNPGFDTMCKWSAELGCSLDELWAGGIES